MLLNDFNKDCFISLIFSGAFGNNLFQVATLIAHAEKNSIPFIVGYWSHFNSTTQQWLDRHKQWCETNPMFRPFAVPDSVKLYGRGYNWPNMFPRLPYFHNSDNTVPSNYNANRVQDKWSYRVDTGREGVYDPIDVGVGTQIQGYFFNKEYWHKQRESVLYFLTFSETFMKKACENIQKTLNTKTTVSLNMRYLDETIPSDILLKETLVDDLESFDWVVRAIEYFPEDYVFIVTSNDLKKGIKQLEDRFPNRTFMPVSGNPGEQMAACSACDNHIVVNSTFAFWCAYLDKNQPNGVTIYSPKFKQRHSPNVVPYDEWIELD